MNKLISASLFFGISIAAVAHAGNRGSCESILVYPQESRGDTFIFMDDPWSRMRYGDYGRSSYRYDRRREWDYSYDDFGYPPVEIYLGNPEECQQMWRVK